jgi:hypothetical protein
MFEALALIGWMSREDAIGFLCKECYFNPPLSPKAARDLWQPYSKAVYNLQKRKVATPEKFPLSQEDDTAKEPFLDSFRHEGESAVLDVIRIDPMELIVHQLWLMTNHPANYRQSTATDTGWADEALRLRSPSPELNILWERPNDIRIELPHGEWFLGFADTLAAIERARHANVSEFDSGRMLLVAGYHRVYARAMNTRGAQDARERSLLIALTSDVERIVLSPSSRAMIAGPAPALFKDFFDPSLAMKVVLREKRYRLHISARVETEIV